MKKVPVNFYTFRLLVSELDVAFYSSDYTRFDRLLDRVISCRIFVQYGGGARYLPAFIKYLESRFYAN